MEPQPTIETARPKKRRTAPWATVAVAVLPCLITGWFSYRQSKIEAELKVKEANIKAEAGYDAILKAVEILQAHDAETVKALANMKGHIQVIEAWMTNMKPHVETHTKEVRLDLPVPSSVRDKASWRPNFPPPPIDVSTTAKIQLPANLDIAAKQSK